MIKIEELHRERAKTMINPEALQLETLPAVIEQHLGRTGVGRQQRDAAAGAGAYPACMHVIRRQLEGLPMTKIVETAGGREDHQQPGFFRERKDAPR